MSTTTYSTVTTFYYTIPSLLNRIEMGVLIKVRNRKEKAIGLDALSTIDSELLVKEYLGSISADIFSKLTGPLGKTLADLETPMEPFEFDETFTHPDTDAETDNCIIFRTIFTDTMDSTSKPAIEKALADTMISYCIWQWLMDSNVPDWPKYENEHQRKYDDLRSLIVRRINLRRTYKLY